MALQFEHTDRFLKEGRIYEPDSATVAGANLTAYMRSKGFATWDELYQWSVDHPEDFWSEMARELHWMQPWRTVREWNPPYVQWFVGA